jgi:hypothetical protein
MPGEDPIRVPQVTQPVQMPTTPPRAILLSHFENLKNIVSLVSPEILKQFLNAAAFGIDPPTKVQQGQVNHKAIRTNDFPMAFAQAVAGKVGRMVSQMQQQQPTQAQTSLRLHTQDQSSPQISTSLEGSMEDDSHVTRHEMQFLSNEELKLFAPVTLEGHRKLMELEQWIKGLPFISTISSELASNPTYVVNTLDTLRGTIFLWKLYDYLGGDVEVNAHLGEFIFKKNCQPLEVSSCRFSLIEKFYYFDQQNCFRRLRAWDCLLTLGC